MPGWKSHKMAERPDGAASGGADGEELERERSGTEAASGAVSDVAAAAETAAIPASGGGSRESASWQVDGAADGGATDGAASGEADGEATDGEASDGAAGGRSVAAGLSWSLLRWTIGEGDRLLPRDDDGE